MDGLGDDSVHDRKGRGVIERRQQIARMTGEFLMTALRAYGVEIPSDVGIISVRHDPFTDRIEFLISSAEFPKVPEGCEPVAICSLMSWHVGDI